MANHVSSVDIVLKAHNHATQELHSAESAVHRLRESIEKLNLIAEASGIVFIFDKLVEFGREIWNAASAGSEATENLHAALRLAGETSEKAAAELDEYAIQIQRVTTYTDDQVQAAMKLGVTMGHLTGEGLKQATNAAVGLAAAYNLDLDTAMKLVTKAVHGKTAALQKMGIAIDQSASPQERLNQLLKIGTDSFVLAEAKTHSWAGAMTKLKNEFDLTLERIGEKINGVPSLFALMTGAMEKIGDGAVWLAEKAMVAFEAIKNAAVSAFNWISANVVPIAVEAGHVIAAGYRILAGIATVAFSAVASAAVWLGNQLLGVLPTWQQFKDTAVTSLAVVEYAFSNWKDIALTVFVGIAYEIVKINGIASYYFGQVIPTYLKYLADNWVNIFVDLANFNERVTTNMFNNLANFFKSIWSWLKGDGVDFKWTALTDGFESSMSALPVIAARHISGLEETLGKSLDSMKGSLGKGLAATIQMRLAEANAATNAVAKHIEEKGMKLASDGTVKVDVLEKMKKPQAGTKEDHDAKTVASLDESRFLTGVRNKIAEDHLALAREQAQLARDLNDKADKQQESLDALVKNTEPSDDAEGVDL